MYNNNNQQQQQKLNKILQLRYQLTQPNDVYPITGDPQLLSDHYSSSSDVISSIKKEMIASSIINNSSLLSANSKKNSGSSSSSSSNNNNVISGSNQWSSSVAPLKSYLGSEFPDFYPWKHTDLDDVMAIRGICKGAAVKPFVNNELVSARHLMHYYLREDDQDHDEDESGNITKLAGTDDDKQSDNSNNKKKKKKQKNRLSNKNFMLDQFSNHLLISIQKRNKINKLGKNSTFKPPPRVTLTEKKKELWMNNLADPAISLRRLSRSIPHGIRNKTLLDQLIDKKIPINRAIWFIKCIALNELRLLKRKQMMGASASYGHSRNNSNTNNNNVQQDSGTSVFIGNFEDDKIPELDNNENIWITEWTQSVANYLKNLLEIAPSDNKPIIKQMIAKDKSESNSADKSQKKYSNEEHNGTQKIASKKNAKDDNDHGSNDSENNSTDNNSSNANDDSKFMIFYLNDLIVQLFIENLINKKLFLSFFINSIIADCGSAASTFSFSDNNKNFDSLHLQNLKLKSSAKNKSPNDAIVDENIGNVISNFKNEKSLNSKIDNNLIPNTAISTSIAMASSANTNSNSTAVAARNNNGNGSNNTVNNENAAISNTNMANHDNNMANHDNNITSNRSNSKSIHDQHDFEKLYITINLFLKCYIGLMIKNYILETNRLESNNSEKLKINNNNNSIFYTNSLKQLIEILIMKYNFIAKKFNSDYLISTFTHSASHITENDNEKVAISNANVTAASLSGNGKTDMSQIITSINDTEQYPANNNNILSPITPMNNKKPFFINTSISNNNNNNNNHTGNNNNTINSPYGLNMLNSPYSAVENSIMMTPEHNDSFMENNNIMNYNSGIESGINVGNAGDDNNNDTEMIDAMELENIDKYEEHQLEKLNLYVYKLRKTILVTIKLSLMQLFSLNNGELFILPKSNWPVLKKILLKYNVLNTRKNTQNLFVSLKVKEDNKNNKTNKNSNSATTTTPSLAIDSTTSNSHNIINSKNSNNNSNDFLSDPESNKNKRMKSIMHEIATRSPVNVVYPASSKGSFMAKSPIANHHNRYFAPSNNNNSVLSNNSNLQIASKSSSSHNGSELTTNRQANEPKAQIPYNSNIILTHGVDLNITKENFIIANNSKILLSKQFEVISSRNDSLLTSISSSLKQLNQFKNYNETPVSSQEKSKKQQKLKNSSGLSLLLKSPNSCNYSAMMFNFLSILTDLSSYEFFYLSDLNIPGKSSLISPNSELSTPILNRRFSFNNSSNTNITDSARKRRRRLSTNIPTSSNSLMGTSNEDYIRKLLMPEFQQSIFNDNIESLISLIFGDFSSVIDTLNSSPTTTTTSQKVTTPTSSTVNNTMIPTSTNSSSISLPNAASTATSSPSFMNNINRTANGILPTNISNASSEIDNIFDDTNNSGVNTSSDFSLIREKLQFLLRYAVAGRVKGSSHQNKSLRRTQLIVYIIKQIISKFRSVLNSNVTCLNSLNNIGTSASTNNNSMLNRLNNSDIPNVGASSINPSARESPIDAFCHETSVTEDVIVDETTFDQSRSISGNINNNANNTQNMNAASMHTNKPVLNKKQLITGFKSFLQGEILDFLFSLYTVQKSSNNSDTSNENNGDKKLKEKISELFNSDSFNGSRVDIDSELIDLLRNNKSICDFNLKDSKIFFYNEKPNLQSLLLLMNSLFEARLVSVNVYIRKLISSGILYLRNLKNFYDLNLFQYIILRNFTYKINNNGILVKNNNTQVNLILNNLKKNLSDYSNNEKYSEDFRLEGSIFSDESDKKLIYKSIEISEISDLEKIVNNIKNKLKFNVIDRILEDTLINTNVDELLSDDIESIIDIPIKLYLSNWLYGQLLQKILSTERSENKAVTFTVCKFSVLDSLFKILGKSDYLFNFFRLILSLFIKPEVISLLNHSDNSKQYLNVDLGYDGVYYILGLLFDHLNVMNFFQDYGDCEIEFESKYSLTITSITIKEQLSSKEKFIKSIDILKLVINSYLKLNDISNSIFGFFNSVESHGFSLIENDQIKEKKVLNKINCYDFIKYWNFFLKSLESFESKITSKSSNMVNTRLQHEEISREVNTEFQNVQEEHFADALDDEDSNSDSNDNDILNDNEDSTSDSNDDNENSNEEYGYGTRSIYVDAPTLNNIRAQLEYLTTEPSTKFNTDYFNKGLDNTLTIQLTREISEYYPDFTFESLINMNEFSKNFQTFLNFIINYETNIPNDDYILNIHLLFLLKKTSRITFIASVLESIKKEIKHFNDGSRGKIMKLIYSIILNGLVDIRTIISSIVTNRDFQQIIDEGSHSSLETNDDEESYIAIFGNNFKWSNVHSAVKLPEDIVNLMHDIVFYNPGLVKLHSSHEYSLKSQQSFFKRTFYNEYSDLMIVFMSFKKHHNDFRSSIGNFICNMEDHSLFAGEAVHNIAHFNYTLMIDIFNEIIFGSRTQKSNKIEHFGQIYQLISNFNIVDYPIMLLLFSTLVSFEILKYKNNKEQILSIRLILIKLLTCFYLMDLSNNLNKASLKKDEKNKNYTSLKNDEKKFSIFTTGFYKMNKDCVSDISNLMIAKNLFQFLRDDIKRIFMVEMERIFLKSNELPELKLMNLRGSVESRMFKICNKYNNFIPYAAVIIDSVSNDLINEGYPIINSSLGVFFASFLDKITKYLATNYENISVKINNKSKAVSKSIYLFLNILFTHKISIIQALYQKSNMLTHNFIPGLINLLKSKYFAKFIQLRNMLYDFLFSIKSNIKELNKSNYTFKALQSSSQGDKIVYNPSEDSAVPGGAQSNEKSSKSSNQNHQIILPKLSNDELNVELTKRLVRILEREDRLAFYGDEKLRSDLMLYNSEKDVCYDLRLNSFDLLEDANPNISANDTSINMKYFDAVIVKSNTY